MGNYHIAPAGNGYQVIEDLPGDRHSFVGGFPTETDAQGWLDSFLVLICLIDCMSGKVTVH